MGRIPYIDVPQHALQLVRPRHREIMRRLVCGQTQRDIAREMGLGEARLSIIVNSPLFKVELRKMERDVRAKAVDSIGDVASRIAKLQKPALDVLEKIVIDDKGVAPLRLKRDAAMDILELAGTKRHKNEEGMNDFAQFVSEAFAEAKARAFDRLNSQLEDEIGDGGRDISGEILPLDEAEDLELAAFTEAEAKVLESAEGCEGEKEVESAGMHLLEAGGNGGGNGNGNGNGSGSHSPSPSSLSTSTPQVETKATPDPQAEIARLFQEVIAREGLNKNTIRKILT